MSAPAPPITWNPGSSNLASCTFDASTDTLTIEFHNGSTYDYMNVPSHVVRDFQNAPSAGQFFHRHIRQRYPYQEQ